MFVILVPFIRDFPYLGFYLFFRHYMLQFHRRYHLIPYLRYFRPHFKGLFLYSGLLQFVVILWLFFSLYKFDFIINKSHIIKKIIFLLFLFIIIFFFLDLLTLFQFLASLNLFSPFVPAGSFLFHEFIKRKLLLDLEIPLHFFST